MGPDRKWLFRGAAAAALTLPLFGCGEKYVPPNPTSTVFTAGTPENTPTPDNTFRLDTNYAHAISQYINEFRIKNNLLPTYSNLELQSLTEGLALDNARLTTQSNRQVNYDWLKKILVDRGIVKPDADFPYIRLENKKIEDAFAYLDSVANTFTKDAKAIMAIGCITQQEKTWCTVLFLPQPTTPITA